MKTPLKVYLLASTLLLSLISINAQSLPDSTMQKINGFRAFYETLGNAYPADSTVSITETTIAGVKSFWFNQRCLVLK